LVFYGRGVTVCEPPGDGVGECVESFAVVDQGAHQGFGQFVGVDGRHPRVLSAGWWCVLVSVRGPLVGYGHREPSTPGAWAPERGAVEPLPNGPQSRPERPVAPCGGDLALLARVGGLRAAKRRFARFWVVQVGCRRRDGCAG